MKHLLSLIAVGAIFGSLFVGTQSALAEKEKKTVLDQEVKSLEGKKVDLSEYKGKVVMVVNVASRCGATPQYSALQDLYETFKDDGLVVIGFPCNQFGKQEPGTADDIREFCTANYGVSFPMMSKIDVNGENASPVYKQLTAAETKPKKAGPIGWNFEKFLIGRNGEVVARYATSTQPDEKEVVDAIQAELKKK